MTEVSKSLPSCLPQISSHCYLPENNHFINNLFRKKGGWGEAFTWELYILRH